jgi:eukaryotic-like serine/threonine-protein kinase
VLPDVPRAGERIGGKWVVEGSLGFGGMGAVLAARHADLGQRVAIKLLLPQHADNSEASARLLREARAVVGMRSEHIARVFDVDRDQRGVPYIVMERLEGTDFHHLLRRVGVLTIGEAVGHVLQACSALTEAHALGLVHRDLKPANLFLAELPDGRTVVKVLDFGISKSTRPGSHAEPSLTGTEHVLGSLHYMSPEQLRNSRNVDARSDIWSLGVILYRMVSGRLPFDDQGTANYLQRLIWDAPTPLAALVPTAPPDFVEVVERCLEKSPEMRPESVGALVAALTPHAARPPLDPFPAVFVDSSPHQTTAGRDDGTARLAGLSSAKELPAPPRARAAERFRLALAVVGTGALVIAMLAIGLGSRGAAAGNPTTAAALRLPRLTWLSMASSSTSPAAGAASTPVVPAPTGELHLSAWPAHATIEVDGKVIAPGKVVFPPGARIVQVLVHAPGYVPQAREVHAPAEAPVRIVLRAAPPPPRKARRHGPLESEL